MAYDVTRIRLGNYDLKWGSYDFGLMDKVKPDIRMKTLPKKAGSIGDVELGEWIIGLEGTISGEVREIDVVTYQKLMPWWVSGDISLLPAVWHKDLYDYAAKLVLHPNDLPALTTTQDITLLKAVGMFVPAERDGGTPDKMMATFKFYPDRAQLVTSGSLLLAYGYIGAGP
ncbi:MAG: hypothetical protein WBD40_03575 [Tepidisphaeraceae bacterium]